MALSTIHWESYSESEIQEIILRCFETAGYSIHNIHKADPAGEKGVDILAVKNGKKTAIAVKMKPKGVDRAQLQDLSEYDAHRRIYIYIKTPTHTFIEYMQRDDIKTAVEFWSGKRIGKNLFDLDPNFLSHLALSYSTSCFECNQIVQLLAKIWLDSIEITSDEHISIAESVNSRLKPHTLLWDLKDHSSSLHRIAMALQTYFEKMTQIAFDVSQQLAILKSCQDMLDKIQDEVIHRFHSVLQDITSIWHDEFLRVASATRNRTTWLYIFNFRKITTAFFANRTKDTFSELQESNERMKELLSRKNKEIDNLYRYEDFKETTNEFSTGIGGISWFFGALRQFAWGVEEIVNGLYASLIEIDYDRQQSDWRSFSDRADDSWSIMGPHGTDESDLIRPFMLDSVFQRDDVARSSKELMKIRFLIMNNTQKIECPTCNNPLVFSTQGSTFLLKCTNPDCNFLFE